MKKLTKKNLKQLSETMTILCETEQRKCVGSGFYYSYDGSFLGFIGNSYDVRVVNANTFYSLQYGNDDACLIGNSVSLFSSDRQTQANIINYMAAGLGLSNIYVNTFYYDKNSGNVNGITGGSTTHDVSKYINPDGSVRYDYHYSYITINNASGTFKNGNFYDIMCMLIHEQDHYKNYNPYTYKKVDSEYSAFGTTIYNEYFEYASPDFKEGAYSQYDYYKKLYYSKYY